MKKLSIIILLIACGLWGQTLLPSSAVLYVSNGSTAGLLQKLVTVSTDSRVVDAAVSDTIGIVGIARLTASAGANTYIDKIGQISCVFDGATTAGDFVQISVTVAGNCKDFGSSYPPNGQVIGKVLSTNSLAGTYAVDLSLSAQVAGPVTGLSATSPCTISTAGAIACPGFTNPMTTAGDLIYGGTTGLPTRVAGAAGILRSSGTVPSYAELSGDITTSGSNATTLASVATAGTTGSSTAIPVITINAKGLTTTITTAAVVAPAGTLTGATLASGVTASSLTSVGTLASPGLTTPIINQPTIGISGTSGSTHVNNVGTAPTCAFSTGGGTSPSCALDTGSTDRFGKMTITTGSGSPGSTGTITLTFNSTMGTNMAVCIATLGTGATAWSVNSTVMHTTYSKTAPVFSWASASATAAVALTASTNYKINYICEGI